MKINKTLIILSLLLIFCINLGAVSATDNDNRNIDDVSIYNNDISVTEGDTVSTTNNEGKISELSADFGDFAELQSAVDNASSGTTLYLTKDYNFVSGNDGNGVLINKALTIDGQGHTISGSGTARAFHVTNDNVVIKNINFTNCYAYNDGGAINIGGKGNVIGCNFTNCYINDNSVKYRGGAVYLNNGGTVSSCNFLNCSNHGGHGGAVYLKGAGTVVDCNFTNCNTTLFKDYYPYGGAVYITGSGTIGDSNFLNCSTYYYGIYTYGGAVYIGGTSNIYNSNFTKCSANRGGALSLTSDSTIINSNFVNCSARGSGCAIYGSVGTISNCSFTDDYASDSYAKVISFTEGTLESCVFLSSSTVYISKGTVINCNFTDSEGIYLAEGSTISNCNFINCSSDDGSAGGAIEFRYSGTVSNCNFVNCSCDCIDSIDHDRYGYGGAIYITNSGTVSNCSFTNCYAFTGGGAIHIGSDAIGGDGFITDCSFTNCSSSGTYGGAVYVWGTGDISNCSFVNCSSNGDGGAIYLTYCSVNDCSFVNCSSYATGGAVCVNDNAEFNNSVFINCSSGVGGAVVVTTGTFNKCMFVDCSVNGQSSCGGAILRFGDEGGIYDSVFINCSANGKDSYGGAVFSCVLENKLEIMELTYYNAYHYIRDCEFIDCHADYGGALYLASQTVDTTCHISWKLFSLACEFIRPHLWTPHAIVIEGGESLNCVDGCTFINCFANKGGAIFNSEGRSYTIDSSYINCSANNCGSAVYIYEDSEFDFSFIDVFIARDNKAPIYNNGTIDYVNIITVESKTWHVNNSQIIELNATVLNSGDHAKVAGGELIFNINGKEIKVKSDVNGLYSTRYVDTNYVVDFTGTKSVDAKYLNSWDSSNDGLISGRLTTDKLDVNLASDNVKGSPGEKLNVTIKVTDINNDSVTGGVVTIKFEGNEYEANVTDSVATVELYLPHFGEYSASAFYNGSTSSLYNDGNLDFTVYAKNFASVAVYTRDNITYGEILTVYGHVTGVEGKSAPTGNVTIYVDGVENGTVNLTENGDIIYFIPKLAGGKHNITLLYNGDGNYAFEGSSVDVTVYPTIFEDLFMVINILNENITWYFAPSSTPLPPHSIDPIPMGPYDPHHVIASSPNNANGISNVKSLSYDYFNPYLLLTNGVANDLNGKILLILDGHFTMVDLINSHGNLTRNGLDAGIHRVTAIFLGNENYTRLKASATFYIPKYSSDAVCTIEDVNYGDNVTVTVNVTGVDGKIPTGNVTIIINNKKIDTVNITKGTVTYSIPNLVSGDYNITVIYNGDKNYNASEFSSKFTVNQLNVSVVVDSVKGEVGEKVNITVRVTDENGNPVPEGTVIIGFNGKQYKANAVNGIATIEVILPNKAGNYSATAYYEGFNYNIFYTSFTVEVSDIPGPNPDPNPNPNPKKDVSNPIRNMENCGTPLIVLLIALICLPILRRK